MHDPRISRSWPDGIDLIGGDGSQINHAPALAADQETTEPDKHTTQHRQQCFTRYSDGAILGMAASPATMTTLSPVERTNTIGVPNETLVVGRCSRICSTEDTARSRRMAT